MPRVRLIVSLFVLGFLALTVASASAHTAATPVRQPSMVEMPTTVLRSGAPSVAVLPAALAVLVLFAACATRRRVAVALLLLTAVVGVDAAVHSVHHLDDAKASARCPLASSTVHAPAAVAESPGAAAGLEPSGPTAGDSIFVRIALAPSRPDRGRAPPSFVA